MEENLIRFDHLSIEYEGIPAVGDLSAVTPSGEVFGLLGPNGTGSSTTILMLAGLIEPSAGCCRIDGIEGATHPLAVKQAFGYIPEDVGSDSTTEQKSQVIKRCVATAPVFVPENEARHSQGRVASPACSGLNRGVHPTTPDILGAYYPEGVKDPMTTMRQNLFVPATFCLVLLITIAILVTAGCRESAQEQKSRMTTAREKHSKKPVSAAIVETGPVAARVQPSLCTS